MAVHQVKRYRCLAVLVSSFSGCGLSFVWVGSRLEKTKKRGSQTIGLTSP